MPRKKALRIGNAIGNSIDAPISNDGDTGEEASVPPCKDGGKSSSENRKRGKKLPALYSSLPLPPCLISLENKFSALNNIYSFLVRQQIQVTWSNSHQAVSDILRMTSQESWDLQDVKDMAAICPSVVWIQPLDSEDYLIELRDSKLKNGQFSQSNKRKIPESSLKNSQDRKAAAFREALALAVQRAHVEFLQQKADGHSGTFDPVENQSWHPHFPLSSLELSSLLPPAANGDPTAGNTAGDKEKSINEAGGSSWDGNRAKVGGSDGASHKFKCQERQPLSAEAMVDHLKAGVGTSGQIVHCEIIPQRNARYGVLESSLSQYSLAALQSLGIEQLYSHQAAAIDHALQGRNVVVSSSTSSGKSLCFHIPVMEAWHSCPHSSALYIFPTKALAQDQLRSMQAMMAGSPLSSLVAIYDGDTPHGDRHRIRETSRVLITNPDMIHSSILPSHASFLSFLTHLRYVIVDECHAYHGTFGCHVALILRRLRRICSRVYGSFPTFILASATIGNAREHSQDLLGVDRVESVQEDGSPHGQKIFLLWNPPSLPHPQIEDSCRTATKRKVQEAGAPPRSFQIRRASPIVQASLLLAEMVLHDLRCIAFCGSRKLCELVLTHTQNLLRDTAPDLVDAVVAYRSGYSPEDRRAVEKRLFSGQLRGVAATNAMELGVDVGDLDATIHLGFQGSVSSMWQQAGRAGRREKSSLAVYVAFDSPLDQYLMKFPSGLFCAAMEEARIDPHNTQVVSQHLACAAHEYPVTLEADEAFFGSVVGEVVQRLVGSGVIGRHPTNAASDASWHYMGVAKSPAASVSIRAIDAVRYSVVEEGSNRVLEEVEESRAFFSIYEGAIFLHQGRTYLVRSLSLSQREARCVRVDVKYYTAVVDKTMVVPFGGSLTFRGSLPSRKYSSTTAESCRCRVTTSWTSFRKIWQGSREAFDFSPLFLPDHSFETQATWLRISPSAIDKVKALDHDTQSSIHAASHAVLNVVPLYMMCTVADMGVECGRLSYSKVESHRILLYDRNSGGIGLAFQAQLMFTELLTAAVELVSACDCEDEKGCPSCIQAAKCGGYNELLDKKGGLLLLQEVLMAERQKFE